MSTARHHAEWLSLVEVSGPFLSMPVLMRVFPQGLEAHDPERFRLLRLAYEEWEDNAQAGRRTNPAIHGQWIRFVLRTILQLPDDCIAEGQAIPQTLQVNVAEHGELLRPNIVIKNPDGGASGGKPRLLMQTYSLNQDLSKPVIGCTWKASPDTRMMELLHATGVRLGLITNGEQWMLVDAPCNETTGFASWYAHLWLEEQITLRAFTSLLSTSRFFSVSDSDTLDSLLAESATNQQEVTDQLGYQVRKAVEVLVQSLDRADQDHGGRLLEGVPETELYEASLTVMMRLVFLFCAEERGLLLLDDPLYDENYAVSTMREQLHETADQHGEEILERRHDAWCRLLATFRGVFGGIEHDRLTLPPYGGKLVDPDRFPFLEGRKRGTSWKTCEASPLPVNNRTILHLLDALQLLQVKLPGGGPAEARRLSFRALDIEQIGHVYEGLLDHTAKRAAEPVLGLAGTKDKEPEVALSTLEDLRTKGEDKFIEFLHDEAGRSVAALGKALKAEPDMTTLSRIEAACGSSKEGKALFDRIRPFVGLVRDDTFGYPVVIPKGSVFVTAGTDRRSSGTHYTPRCLTEPIVQYTLEPLVYVGPAEGKPKDQWKLKTAKELLDLKVCDMACGSGAFLVQACRYMSERLMEAWELAEKALPKGTPGITPEGTASTGKPGELLISSDPDERRAFSLRLVAQRCLYGVDINPLAAEMAKLSLWLLTLAKDKPFTFLDHAIRCGDSLVGIHNIYQLKNFNLDPKGTKQYLFTEPLEKMMDEAISLRLKIESMPSNRVEDVEAQARLMAECEQRVEFLKCAADMLIAAELKGGGPRERLGNQDHAAIQVGHYLKEGQPGEFRAAATKELGGRRTFHWPLEFPEVFVRSGFDAFVGNPPFIGGKRITGALGTDYRDYLVRNIASGKRGNADLSAYFFLQAHQLLCGAGHFGLVATNTIAQGDTREVGLEQIVERNATITRAVGSCPWPGTASLEVAHVWVKRGGWNGNRVLDGHDVLGITPLLTSSEAIRSKPYRLKANEEKAFIGSLLVGLGFVLTPSRALGLIETQPENKEVLFPYLSGDDLNSTINQSPSRWVINFNDWPRERADWGSWFKLLGEERISCLRNGVVPDDYPGRVASDFADCFEIILKEVKPEREKLAGGGASARALARRWWQHGRQAKELYTQLFGRDRVLVCARVSKYNSFCFVPTGYVLMEKTIGFPQAGFQEFAVQQSNIHEVWVRNYSSTLETRLNYAPSDCFLAFRRFLGPRKATRWQEPTDSRGFSQVPTTGRISLCALAPMAHAEIAQSVQDPHESSVFRASRICERPDCFETFPFPPMADNVGFLGNAYHEFRCQIMQRRQEGLTKTYNRFHDPDDSAKDIQKLRDLHVEMDKAVAAAYGWDDLDLGHGFHQTKQGLRFTVSEPARREVLVRLLKLNHERYAEEVAQGLHDKKKGKGRKKADAKQGAELFEEAD
jgi:hypothetical protein